jgi:uncharacterized membrane protein YdjX (TVP38/TMEM64 family)
VEVLYSLIDMTQPQHYAEPVKGIAEPLKPRLGKSEPAGPLNTMNSTENVRQPETRTTLRNLIPSFIQGVRSLDARQRRKIVLAVAGFIGITIGFMYLSSLILGLIHLPLDRYMWMSYLTVFLTFLVVNLSLFSPLPLAISVLATSALIWNPAIMGLAAAFGASIGEMSGYLAGRLGRNIFKRENFVCSIQARFCNSRLSNDVERYGPAAIAILAAQPILPFDIGGVIAGSLKMNVFKFFGAVLLGKCMKYVLIAYAAGMLSHLPFINL